MTAEDALKQLAVSTQEAVAGALRIFAPDNVVTEGAAVVASGASPIAGLQFPAVAASVSYVDGVSGGNVFVMTRVGARKLAATMMGIDPDGIEDDELSELEVSAVGEAMNQMMTAAASATSSVLEEEVEISPPATRVLLSAEDAAEFVEDAPYATVAALTVLGERCDLVQLVPAAFVMRMTRALAELEGDAVEETSTTYEPALAEQQPARQSIRQVPVRLSVELGRTRMPVGDAVRLWRGAIVDLEAPVDAPLELRVNGLPLAEGRLVLLDGSSWAVRVDRVVAHPTVAELDSQHAAGEG
jgi:flagellar motor switch protein FliN/FliY